MSRPSIDREQSWKVIRQHPGCEDFSPEQCVQLTIKISNYLALCDSNTKELTISTKLRGLELLRILESLTTYQLHECLSYYLGGVSLQENGFTDGHRFSRHAAYALNKLELAIRYGQKQPRINPNSTENTKNSENDVKNAVFSTTLGSFWYYCCHCGHKLSTKEAHILEGVGYCHVYCALCCPVVEEGVECLSEHKYHIENTVHVEENPVLNSAVAEKMSTYLL